MSNKSKYNVTIQRKLLDTITNDSTKKLLYILLYLSQGINLGESEKNYWPSGLTPIAILK
jgi:hypothetical protein